MLCKCGQPCIIRTSKKPTSYDEEFYACPGGQNGCQGWIGWVDESKNQKKPVFKSSFKKGGASNFSKQNEEEVCYNSDGEPCCKECGISCITKTSRTEKNMNREFFVCQKNCQVWNGWADSPNAVKTYFKKSSNNTVVPPKPQVPKSTSTPTQTPITSTKNTTTSTKNTTASTKNTTSTTPIKPAPAPQRAPAKAPTKSSPTKAPVKSMLAEERFSDDDIDLNDEY